MFTTIAKKVAQQLIFGGDLTSKESIEDDFEKTDEKRREGGWGDRPSAYVTVFEGMVTTIITNEPGLLSEEEINVLDQFDKLCYNTRYTLIRLVLRKADTWHPVSSLAGFEKEIGSQGLRSAISDLCTPISALLDTEDSGPCLKSEDVPVKLEEGTEIIDLSMDSDDEDVNPCIEADMKPKLGEAIANYWSNKASTSQVLPSPSVSPTASSTVDPLEILLQSNPGDLNLSFFCEDEAVMTTEEILWRLPNPELQQLVKKMKCKPKSGNKSDMIWALHNHASTQSILNFTTPKNSKKKEKAPADGLRQTQLPFQSSSKKCTKKAESQQDRLRELALKALGPCIRVNFDFFRLVRRLHIIYYREVEHPTALLLPSLLTTFKKRHFTSYNTIRSTDIWSSREELLQYEKALEVEQILLNILDPPVEKFGRRAAKTPARTRAKLTTPITPRKEGDKSLQPQTPVKTPTTNPILDLPSPSVLDNMLRFPSWGDENMDGDEPLEVRKEIKIKEYLDRWLFPHWQQHLAVRTAQDLGDLADRSPGLARFETGYVYTRMVSKAATVLGPLKEYEAELKVIEHLLGQKFWIRGKRGKLYERRAVVHGHLAKGAERTTWLEMAVEGLKEALLDPDTGMVWRPNLMTRLMKLEKRLKVPPEEMSQCSGRLRQANVVVLKATRVNPLLFDALGRPILGKENTIGGGLSAFITVSKNSCEAAKPDQPDPNKGRSGHKSRWQGRNGQIVDVETVALENYEDQGYKGFHSETRILTTIYGLLFWDIIFADIPGAFETAFQSAPLDMFEDSFYYARKALIDARLSEIRLGSALQIIQRHDDMYREKKTWCLCVSWDVCNKEDLVEIIECMSGESLATICTLFCQDYRGRCSGGPDLFIWNPKSRTCKFVEVKGPGDVARENQKLWFDSLLGADVDVDVCRVVDRNDQSNPQGNFRKRKVQTPRSGVQQKGLAASDNPLEDEDYDQSDPERVEEFNPTFQESASLIKFKRRKTVCASPSPTTSS